jgi:acyl-CoA synthetase (AMP-forming)/AMP-acid ligase II/aminoglycoside N3'-acetyltransferase
MQRNSISYRGHAFIETARLQKSLMHELVTLDQLPQRHHALAGDGPLAIFPRNTALNGASLDDLAARMAWMLAGRGLGRGSRVLLVHEPGPDQLVSLMACWKLGAMVSPVDRFLSREALARLVEQFSPDVALLDPCFGRTPELAEAIQAKGVEALVVGAEQLPERGAFDGRAQPDDPALSLFTSGSTGLPKGVQLTHAALLAGARNLVDAKAVGSQDRVLCVLPLSHMNGLVTTFLAPLLSGGSVVYMQEDFQPCRALRLIDHYKCTWFSAVPTHYTLMVSPPVDRDEWSLASLRFCRSASAPLAPRTLRDFESHYGAPIIETMGTTETAGQIFSNPLPPALHKQGKVGFPYGFDVRLVGESGEVVQPEQIGELQVQGPAIMLGYLDDPEETAKAFDGPWFKTGDLAQRDEEGYYSIKGRTKDIAIFCGLNVSLRAIEISVMELGWVQDVACKGVEHPVFGETVSVYVLPQPGFEDYVSMSSKIEQCVALHLPNIQALSSIRFVSTLPRSSVGKVLKGRLDECEVLYKSRRKLPREPRALVAMVLGVSEDTVDENLAMGAVPQWDSLGYVALMAAVETVLERELAPWEVAALRTFPGIKAVLTGDHREVETIVRQGDSAVREVVSRLEDLGMGAFPVNYVILGYSYCLELGVYNAEALLEAILDSIGMDNTLVMNAFSWHFCRKGEYHWKSIPCEMGLVNEMFRRRDDVVTTRHPIYTYAAWGPHKSSFVEHECPTCWGEGSVTRRLAERGDVRVITLGVPHLYGTLLRGNPVLHTLEEMYRPSHRFPKLFDGRVNFGQGWREYRTEMLVKALDSEYVSYWRPLSDMLESRNMAYRDDERLMYGYMNCHVLEVGQEILSKDRDALMRRFSDLTRAEQDMGPKFSDTLQRWSSE